MPRQKSGSFDQVKYDNQFKRDHYDRIGVLVPKGRKEDIDVYAKEEGLTVNGLINKALRTTLGMTEEEWKAQSKSND